jgi:hypothetical protein
VRERPAQPFDAPAIDAKIAVPEARRRAHRDSTLRRAQVELEIVDKAENSAAALGVKILIGFSDDSGPRPICDY